MQASAKYKLNEMNSRLADGDFKNIYNATIDEDSDESVDRPCQKKNKHKILSTSE
jgi:hypothetical protein